VCLKLLRDLTRNRTLTEDRARKIKIYYLNRTLKNTSDVLNINVSTERLNRSHILQQMLKSSLHKKLQMREASDTHL